MDKLLLQVSAAGSLGAEAAGRLKSVHKTGLNRKTAGLSRSESVGQSFASGINSCLPWPLRLAGSSKSERSEQEGMVMKCCFTSTETVGLLGTGAQDGHLDCHTAPEL